MPMTQNNLDPALLLMQRILSSERDRIHTTLDPAGPPAPKYSWSIPTRIQNILNPAEGEIH